MILELIILVSMIGVFVIVARRLPDVIRQKTIIKLPLKSEESRFSQQKEKIPSFSLLDEGDRYFSQNDFSRAERLYLQAISKDPHNAKIYNRLGVIYLEQKNFSDAKEAFLEALKKDNSLASRHYNLSLAYLGLKDYNKTLESLKQVVKLEPKNEKYQKTFRDIEEKYGKK